MTFLQSPPELGNQFTTDPVLRAYLSRALPDDVQREIAPTLEEMGELAGGSLSQALLDQRNDEPKLVQWDAWGQRVDHIELTAHWKHVARIAAECGVVATAYERRHGRHSRVHQFALAYLFEPASGVYTCPLAMTDGAAKTLLTLGSARLVDRALARLTSRDPSRAWTSGQWMTERAGGSDVAISEAMARPERDGAYRLYGTKWFTSATTSQMALTLARPEGNAAGGKGLALFYVELRREDGTMNGVLVHRLKEKLGTRMVPTAEITLDGTLAFPVAGLHDGIKNITPMLTMTRTWNAVCAVGGMRRGLALARDYAGRRVAFGAKLADKPLHVDTLAGLEAEYQGAFQLAFRAVELLGREEAGEISDGEAQLLRLVTPIAKLTTGRQAVGIASEVLEAFGGAGYVEDTGLPRLLRDAQVLPIWEGTTNVLSLDVLRALARGGSLDTIDAEIRRCTEGVGGGRLEGPARAAREAVLHARAWVTAAMGRGPRAVEAGGRRFAMTLGRALEVALLVAQAGSDERAGREPRAAAAARRLAQTPIDLIVDGDDEADARTLAS